MLNSLNSVLTFWRYFYPK